MGEIDIGQILSHAKSLPLPHTIIVVMERKDIKREVWIDWMRVAACFFVMVTHCCEPFYYGGEGTLLLSQSDAVWLSVINSLVRASVALFVVASSYLLFPLHYSSGKFVRKRAVRVLIPFLFWTVVYALVWGEPIRDFSDLLLNFNYAAGHLWFVYMLIGLYALMPLLSPWAEKVQKTELRVYLAIWLFTTMIPLIRNCLGGMPPFIYGPSGIPNPAKYPLWGEAGWNAYGTFYYLSGFIGYMLLGLYFRRFVRKLSWRRTLGFALPLFVAGFAICSVGFFCNVSNDAGGNFPVSGPIAIASFWEGPWLNDSIGVVLMATGWILLFRKFNCMGSFYTRILLPISEASYGMYLCHLLLLVPVSSWIRTSLGTGADGILGIWTTPLEMLLPAIISFVALSVLCALVRRIPQIGKWIVG